MGKENIVEIRNVSIDYKMKKHALRAVSDISLDIKRGSMTALVGESGSGKTTLASSLIRCISSPGELAGGTITLYETPEEAGISIDTLPESRMEKLRWEKIAMVFQAAQSSFNPIMTIGEHFWETSRYHDEKKKKDEVYQRAGELLSYVKLDAGRVLNAYPHELSGGMKQRTAIAFALLLNPSLMILDEPTTALDVITQRYIFEILKKIRQEMGISMLLMTHDINVVAQFSDYVGVMYAGRLMEYGKTKDVFYHPRHPYTKGLLAATPSLTCEVERLKPIGGNPPNLWQAPQGCVFQERCPFASEQCRREEPGDIVLGERFYKCCLEEESVCH